MRQGISQSVSNARGFLCNPLVHALVEKIQTASCSLLKGSPKFRCPDRGHGVFLWVRWMLLQKCPRHQIYFFAEPNEVHHQERGEIHL